MNALGEPHCLGGGASGPPGKHDNKAANGTNVCRKATYRAAVLAAAPAHAAPVTVTKATRLLHADLGCTALLIPWTCGGGANQQFQRRSA